jgi:hypothetical protein
MATTKHPLSILKAIAIAVAFVGGALAFGLLARGLRGGEWTSLPFDVLVRQCLAAIAVLAVAIYLMQVWPTSIMGRVARNTIFGATLASGLTLFGNVYLLLARGPHALVGWKYVCMIAAIAAIVLGVALTAMRR